MTLAEMVRSARFIATHELLAAGYTSYQLARAVGRGHIVRVRQGWYSPPELDEPLQRAARVGGRLTCVSAARMLGLPVLRERGLHVAVVRTASRLRDSMDRSARLGRGAGVRVHWRDCGIGDRLVRETLAVLVDMSTCQAPEVTIAAVDAALREGLITIAAWMHAVSQLPRKLRALLAQVDGLAESIIESLTRVRLRGLGIHAQLQVRIPGVGRIDLLVGTRLVIEVDGRRFHETEEAFERDRDRDARLSIRGYRVLRFTYKQVTERWSQVKAAILAAMARGDHLA